MTERKPCKECPWVLDDKKSVQWREYINGKVNCNTHNLEGIKNVIHRCHMLDRNTFETTGKNIFTTPTTNLCIGSCNQHGRDIHNRTN